VRYRKVNTYSLGMKQLIKLAQALAHGPKLLILDEPTNGLDPIARQRMIQLIKDSQEGSVHLLISSHLLRDIDETCDEVLILKRGRIAALCNIEEERRSNRSFMELETVGATENFLDQRHSRTWLRMRMLPWRPHQARDSRPYRSA
jgi:ABC-2 type transport system ATP-binding protein